MATFRKKGGRYEAQVYKRGIRKSRTFHRLTDAKAWALQTESQIERGETATKEMPLTDLLDRYEREISRHICLASVLCCASFFTLALIVQNFCKCLCFPHITLRLADSAYLYKRRIPHNSLLGR